MPLTHPLVEAYLERVHVAGTRLSARQLSAVVDEVHAHLDAALLPNPSDAEVRAALSDLGTPDQLVAAAALREDGGPARSLPGHVVGRTVGREILALVLLVVGPFLNLLPPLGMLTWVLGGVLFYTSTLWSRRDKAFGTFLVGIPLLVFGVGLAGLALSEDCVVPAGGGVPQCGPVPLVFGVNPAYLILPVALAWLVLALYGFLRLVRALR
nr:hypothetical protein [Propionibacterium sp.]